jgi:pyruvate,water dikinase
MNPWWPKKEIQLAAPELSIRSRYASFRRILSLNNDCLEVLAGIQEDLQFAPPSRHILGNRIGVVFEEIGNIVAALERLTGDRFAALAAAVDLQSKEVESYIAARDELARPPLARWLREIDRSSEAEAGGKAAALGEIRNRLLLPVPDGFVITAEASRQFCGIPMWREMRDSARSLDLNDLHALEEVSATLAARVRKIPLPRAIEVALLERAAQLLQSSGSGLAIRSSAVGEGGEKTFAGQFLSLLNVPLHGVADAYREVVASRFGARALCYRLSTGLPEIENPMAVLCLRAIPALAAGIMYTRDPRNPKSDVLWITATRGLGLDVASGRAPADLTILARNKRSHPILEQFLAHKEELLVLSEDGGIVRRPVPPEQARQSSLSPPHLQTLSDWALRLEDHFGCPQDVEWVLDEQDKLWIVQSRPLALAESRTWPLKSRIHDQPILSGGRTVFPGRVSGTAYLATDMNALSQTPPGAILFLRKASPEIVETFPRISGLAAEWGNLTGHAASLLREFAIPSVFQLQGAFEKLRNGDAVSLDAVQPRLYLGKHWPERNFDLPLPKSARKKNDDPINHRVLTLHLQDPASFSFRPAGCQSAHDILRFCHEKAIQAMFDLNDGEIAQGAPSIKKLLAHAPVNLHVLDLGGGLEKTAATAAEVTPQQIVSRPFQALWRGVNHPGVSWTREIPVSLGDLASVMTTSLAAAPGPIRALGEKSYLLVADEYMNLNSRLAYHFTLVDACISDIPSNNYISFRFAGGGAARLRRNLRASFIEGCLSHYGFKIDRRGDLVNAWYKKAPAAQTEANLDILGRLMACSCQLDMYMLSRAVAGWYVQQFLAGNYAFQQPSGQPRAVAS